MANFTSSRKRLLEFVLPIIMIVGLEYLSCGITISETESPPLINRLDNSDTAILDNQVVLPVEDAIEFCGEKFSTKETRVVCNSAIEDLTPLKKLENLQHLNIRGTKVKDLKPISDLSNIETLNLENTLVEDLSPLVGLRNLKSIEIQNAPISDYTVLLNWPFGRELCAIVAEPSYCGKHRLGKPEQSTIDKIVSMANRIRVIESYSRWEELSVAIIRKRIEEREIPKPVQYPFMRVLYESHNVKEIQKLKMLLRIREEDDWFLDMTKGNPKIEFYADDVLISIFAINQCDRLRMIVPEGQDLFRKVWNGDAYLKRPEKLGRWLKKKGIDSREDERRKRSYEKR